MALFTTFGMQKDDILYVRVLKEVDTKRWFPTDGVRTVNVLNKGPGVKFQNV